MSSEGSDAPIVPKRLGEGGWGGGSWVHGNRRETGVWLSWMVAPRLNRAVETGGRRARVLWKRAGGVHAGLCTIPALEDDSVIRGVVQHFEQLRRILSCCVSIFDS
jgi:hypothetical protein